MSSYSSIVRKNASSNGLSKICKDNVQTGVLIEKNYCDRSTGRKLSNIRLVDSSASNCKEDLNSDGLNTRIRVEKENEAAVNVKSPIAAGIGKRQFIQKTETTHTLVTDSTGAYFLQSETQTQSMISNNLEEFPALGAGRRHKRQSSSERCEQTNLNGNFFHTSELSPYATPFVYTGFFEKVLGDSSSKLDDKKNCEDGRKDFALNGKDLMILESKEEGDDRNSLKEAEDVNTDFASSSLSRRKYLSNLSANAKPFESKGRSLDIRGKDEVDGIAKKRVEAFDASKIPFSVPRLCNHKDPVNIETFSTHDGQKDKSFTEKSSHAKGSDEPISKANTAFSTKGSVTECLISRRSISKDGKPFLENLERLEKNFFKCRSGSEERKCSSTTTEVRNDLQNKSLPKLFVINGESSSDKSQVENENKYPLMPLLSSPVKTSTHSCSNLQVDAHSLCFAKQLIDSNEHSVQKQGVNSVNTVVASENVNKLEQSESTADPSLFSLKIPADKTIYSCRQLNGVDRKNAVAIEEQTKILPNNDYKISNTYEGWCKDRNTLSKGSNCPNTNVNISARRSENAEECSNFTKFSYTSHNCTRDNGESLKPEHSSSVALPSNRASPPPNMNMIINLFPHNKGSNEEPKSNGVESHDSWGKEKRYICADESKVLSLLKLQAVADALTPKDKVKQKSQQGNTCPEKHTFLLSDKTDTPESSVLSCNITDPDNIKMCPTQIITRQSGAFDSKTIRKQVAQRHLNGLRTHDNQNTIMQIVSNEPNKIPEVEVDNDKKLLQIHNTNETFVSSVASEESKAKFTPQPKRTTAIQNSGDDESSNVNYAPRCSTKTTEYDFSKFDSLRSENIMNNSQLLPSNKTLAPTYNVPRFLTPRSTISQTNGTELSNLQTIADQIVPKKNVKKLTVSNCNCTNIQDHLTRFKMRNNQNTTRWSSIDAFGSPNVDNEFQSFNKLSILPTISPDIPPRRRISKQNYPEDNSLISTGNGKNLTSFSKVNGLLEDENRAAMWLEAVEDNYISKRIVSDNLKSWHTSHIGPLGVLKTEPPPFYCNDTNLQKHVKNPFVMDANFIDSQSSSSNSCIETVNAEISHNSNLPRSKNPFLDDQDEIVSETSSRNTLDIVDLPGDPLWFYIDPKGETQGPFMSIEMAEWFHVGYFNDYLKVRRNCDKRFASIEEFLKLTGSSSPFLDSGSIPPMESEEQIPRISTNPFLYDI